MSVVATGCGPGYVNSVSNDPHASHPPAPAVAPTVTGRERRRRQEVAAAADGTRRMEGRRVASWGRREGRSAWMGEAREPSGRSRLAMAMLKPCSLPGFLKEGIESGFGVGAMAMLKPCRMTGVWMGVACRTSGLGSESRSGYSLLGTTRFRCTASGIVG